MFALSLQQLVKDISLLYIQKRLVIAKVLFIAKDDNSIKLRNSRHNNLLVIIIYTTLSLWYHNILTHRVTSTAFHCLIHCLKRWATVGIHMTCNCVIKSLCPTVKKLTYHYNIYTCICHLNIILNLLYSGWREIDANAVSISRCPIACTSEFRHGISLCTSVSSWVTTL